MSYRTSPQSPLTHLWSFLLALSQSIMVLDLLMHLLDFILKHLDLCLGLVGEMHTLFKLLLLHPQSLHLHGASTDFLKLLFELHNLLLGGCKYKHGQPEGRILGRIQSYRLRLTVSMDSLLLGSSNLLLQELSLCLLHG